MKKIFNCIAISLISLSLFVSQIFAAQEPEKENQSIDEAARLMGEHLNTLSPTVNLLKDLSVNRLLNSWNVLDYDDNNREVKNLLELFNVCMELGCSMDDVGSYAVADDTLLTYAKGFLEKMLKSDATMSELFKVPDDGMGFINGALVLFRLKDPFGNGEETFIKFDFLTTTLASIIEGARRTQSFVLSILFFKILSEKSFVVQDTKKLLSKVLINMVELVIDPKWRALCLECKNAIQAALPNMDRVSLLYISQEAALVLDNKDTFKGAAQIFDYTFKSKLKTELDKEINVSPETGLTEAEASAQAEYIKTHRLEMKARKVIVDAFDFTEKHGKDHENDFSRLPYDDVMKKAVQFFAYIYNQFKQASLVDLSPVAKLMESQIVTSKAVPLIYRIIQSYIIMDQLAEFSRDINKSNSSEAKLYDSFVGYIVIMNNSLRRSDLFESIAKNNKFSAYRRQSLTCCYILFSSTCLSREFIDWGTVKFLLHAKSFPCLANRILDSIRKNYIGKDEEVARMLEICDWFPNNALTPFTPDMPFMPMFSETSPYKDGCLSASFGADKLYEDGLEYKNKLVTALKSEAPVLVGGVGVAADAVNIDLLNFAEEPIVVNPDFVSAYKTKLLAFVPKLKEIANQDVDLFSSAALAFPARDLNIFDEFVFKGENADLCKRAAKNLFAAILSKPNTIQKLTKKPKKGSFDSDAVKALAFFVRTLRSMNIVTQQDLVALLGKNIFKIQTPLVAEIEFRRALVYYLLASSFSKGDNLAFVDGFVKNLVFNDIYESGFGKVVRYFLKGLKNPILKQEVLNCCNNIKKDETPSGKNCVKLANDLSSIAVDEAAPSAVPAEVPAEVPDLISFE